MRRRRCIKSPLSIERVHGFRSPDVSRRRWDREKRSAYVHPSLFPAGITRVPRYSRASALHGSGRRFVACNGHVHPLSPGLAPVIYDRPAAIYTYRAHTLASLKSHRAFWTWNMERPPRGGEPRRILRGSLLYESTGGNVASPSSSLPPLVDAQWMLYQRMMYFVHTIKSTGLFPGFCDRLHRDMEKNCPLSRNRYMGSHRMTRSSSSAWRYEVFP